MSAWQALNKQGFDTLGGTPDDFSRYIQTEIAQWGTRRGVGRTEEVRSCSLRILGLIAHNSSKH
jgi:hypothetical protein